MKIVDGSAPVGLNRAFFISILWLRRAGTVSFFALLVFPVFSGKWCHLVAVKSSTSKKVHGMRPVERDEVLQKGQRETRLVHWQSKWLKGTEGSNEVCKILWKAPSIQANYFDILTWPHTKWWSTRRESSQNTLSGPWGDSMCNFCSKGIYSLVSLKQSEKPVEFVLGCLEDDTWWYYQPLQQGQFF